MAKLTEKERLQKKAKELGVYKDEYTSKQLKELIKIAQEKETPAEKSPAEKALAEAAEIAEKALAEAAAEAAEISSQSNKEAIELQEEYYAKLREKKDETMKRLKKNFKVVEFKEDEEFVLLTGKTKRPITTRCSQDQLLAVADAIFGKQVNQVKTNMNIRKRGLLMRLIANKEMK